MRSKRQAPIHRGAGRSHAFDLDTVGRRFGAATARILGWIEGRTVAIEYRWAEGRPDRYAEIAAEFVRLRVDVIVTTGGAIIALKKATSVIPIVFAMASDPVGGGLVASLSRPGGNVTGLSLEETDLAGKRLGLLREVLRKFHRLAILVNAGNPGTVLEIGEIETTVRTLGIHFH